MAEPRSPAGGAARDLAIVLALGIASLLPQLLSRDVWGPDETRYAEVAREMIARGDYLVPHLNGQVYYEKPPLFFWLTAALWRVFGPEAGRVVATASALGALALTYAIGRRLHGREVGLWAAIIVLTTLLFATISKCGILDTLLLLTILAAISCGLAAMEGKARMASAWWLGAYAAGALGVLTKGPLGVVIPGLVLLAHGIVRRRHIRAGGWWHLAGSLLMLSLIAAWLVPAIARGGSGYGYRIVFQQTAERFGSSAIHDEPPYYYLMWFPVHFWPWSLLLPLALAAALRGARRQGDRPGLLPALWFLGVFVFFTLIAGKRERYLMPGVPAAGLVCAFYLCAAARGETPWPRWHKALWAATGAFLLLLSGALFALAAAPASLAKLATSDGLARQEIAAVLGHLQRALAVAAGLGLCVVGACLLRLPHEGLWARRRTRLLAGAALAVGLAGDLAALPAMNRRRSEAILVADFRAHIEAADEVYLLQSDFGGVFNLHLRHAHFELLEYPYQAARLLSSGRRVAIVAWQKAAQRVLAEGHGRIITRSRATGRNIVLIVN